LRSSHVKLKNLGAIQGTIYEETSSPGLSWAMKKRSGQPAMNRSKQSGMGIKAVVVLLLGLVLASGCAASGTSRYRPCHELRTDMSVSNDEYEFHCPTRYRE
jgi:hypothetical protein